VFLEGFEGAAPNFTVQHLDGDVDGFGGDLGMGLFGQIVDRDTGRDRASSSAVN
jgi:hypothetical protein